LKKIVNLLLMSVLVCSLGMPAFPQEKEAGTAGDAKTGQQGRWEGMVVRTNPDKSQLTVRARGSNTEKTVQYDSSTKWVSQEHGSKQVNQIDAGQVKDDDRVICVGILDKDGMLHASLISKRLTK
jgi:hypothetical protein